MASDPFALADEAAAALAARTGRARHHVAVWLGSGWGDAAERIGSGTDVALAELPGFTPTTAGGHRAVVRSVDLDGLGVLVFLGRVHLYEGHPVATVVHGVRTAARAGCTVAVLTNAAGYLRPEWTLGSAVLVRDQINATAESPLTGPLPPPGWGPRVCDMTEIYSARLRALAREIDPSLAEGVYYGLRGPQFETPAEIRMIGILGADLVGMSTVNEAIAARHAGMEVLGVSLATNLAAGLAAGPLSGEEVIDAGRAAAGAVGELLRRFLVRLAAFDAR
jgi:purine-nucleoside phosphorylase